MVDAMSDVGNPSSVHTEGRRMRDRVERARNSVAALVGRPREQVLFTSGGTEANWLGVLALAAVAEQRGLAKVVGTTAIEHPSLRGAIAHLQTRGWEVVHDLERASVIAIGLVNHELGTVASLPASAALVHVDAVQAAGKLPIDLAAEAAIDYLTISGHKFHGLKGAGALFVRKDAGFAPLLRGGHHESGKRAGTENVLGIVAMGAASRMVSAKLDDYAAHMSKMRDRLQTSLLNTVDDIILNGDQHERLPNTVNVGFKYIDGEAALMMMDAENICVSAGSACKSGSIEPSHVLLAMNVPLSAIHGSLRFCTSRYTTEEEVDELVQKTAKIVKRLREMSPFGKDHKPQGLTREQLDKHKAYFSSVVSG